MGKLEQPVVPEQSQKSDTLSQSEVAKQVEKLALNVGLLKGLVGILSRTGAKATKLLFFGKK